jgi:hypothetical protein
MNMNEIMRAYVRCEEVAVVTVNITVSWDVTPCRLADVYRRFGGGVASIFRVGERIVEEISVHIGRKAVRIGALSDSTAVRRLEVCQTRQFLVELRNNSSE